MKFWIKLTIYLIGILSVSIGISLIFVISVVNYGITLQPFITVISLMIVMIGFATKIGTTWLIEKKGGSP